MKCPLRIHFNNEVISDGEFTVLLDYGKDTGDDLFKKITDVLNQNGFLENKKIGNVDNMYVHTPIPGNTKIDADEHAFYNGFNGFNMDSPETFLTFDVTLVTKGGRKSRKSRKTKKSRKSRQSR
jgi:hypothetical protein